MGIVMKPHVLPSSLWLPLLVIAVLIAGFAVLMFITEPSARIPSVL
jgi:hypothetical protein